MGCSNYLHNCENGCQLTIGDRVSISVPDHVFCHDWNKSNGKQSTVKKIDIWNKCCLLSNGRDFPCDFLTKA